MKSPIFKWLMMFVIPILKCYVLIWWVSLELNYLFKWTNIISQNFSFILFNFHLYVVCGKDLQINTNPLDLYRPYVNQMEMMSGKPRYALIFLKNRYMWLHFHQNVKFSSWSCSHRFHFFCISVQFRIFK